MSTTTDSSSITRILAAGSFSITANDPHSPNDASLFNGDGLFPLRFPLGHSCGTRRVSRLQLASLLTASVRCSCGCHASRRLRRLRHGDLRPLADLRGREVLLMGGETPVVPERIDEPAEAVTPEHVGRLHRCPAASVNGPPEGE